MTILPIGATSPNTVQSRNDTKKQEVAAGVGAIGAGTVAGVQKSATMAAGKRAMAAEGKFAQTLDRIIETSRKATEGTKKANSMLSGLKLNAAKYTKDILTRLGTLQNKKVIGPVVKMVKGPFAAFFGGALAFFVLITGVAKTIQTGTVAANDIKHQYADMKTAA